MFKSLIQIVKRLVDVRIIIIFFLLAILLLLCPWQFIPDYFKLGNVTERKDIVFRMLTTIVGSSSIILTLLLVGYNFYVKTTRRVTLEFITDNRSLQFIVSLFFAMVIFLGTGFFLLDTGNLVNNTTFLYFAYILTIFFLLILFPLALLALKESNSLTKVYKILDSITDADIEGLYLTQFDDNQLLDNIEKHPVLIVRDLCITAVNDKDWVIPQTVLSRLYNRLIAPLHQQSHSVEIQRAIFIWTLIANGLKRDVIKNNDYATGNALFNLTLNIHEHFATNKIVSIRHNEVDDLLGDYLRLMMENNAFYMIQSYISRNLTQIIQCYFEALQYTDEEIPTTEYRISNRKKIADLTYETTPLTGLWFYLTHGLLDLFFNTMEHAIDVRRKVIYESAFWNIQHTMNIISQADNLTASQKQNAIKELMFKTRKLSDYAIAHQIYEGIEPVSDTQIPIWFEKDVFLGWDALYSFGRMLQMLSETNADLTLYMDRFFMIGRVVVGRTLNRDLLNKVVEYILELALKLLKKEKSSFPLRQAILYQLNWFYTDYLDNNETLLIVREKYFAEITALLQDHAGEIPKYW